MTSTDQALPARPAGDYGTDAPWVPWVWLGFGALYLVIAVLTTLGHAPGGTVLTFLVLGLCFVAGGLLYVHSTKRGKFEVWAELLAGLGDPPPRSVLDIGCGRGAVAIAAALRFPDAEVTGVDLWRSVDQSGNDPSATEANARANGVADRLTLLTADMTDLPFPDGSFDLVTASLSIHNVKPAAARARAVTEAWRCLAPGGRLVIVDLPRIREYAVTLGELSGSPVRPRGIGWRMWWSGPWMRSQVLDVTKVS
ncbi:Methyltransferase domain protein [Nostocoides japonicum T1-X7]|uniref:Methyltransferase domain protein n=1 Tax=Nostocoides japonicum T1-X7 TaxID=1194083 RepID=A0A077LV54_9MICO|nr:class I SAM-dependent methyltransferase [Tetrasphaera japonica]CCH75899.1 Methyltransferase domain protein [Tetrasphaera japonica T1-X7]